MNHALFKKHSLLYALLVIQFFQEEMTCDIGGPDERIEPPLRAVGVCWEPGLATIVSGQWDNIRKSPQCHTQGLQLQHDEAGKCVLKITLYLRERIL